MQELVENIKAWSPEKRRSELRNFLVATAESLRQAAQIVRVMVDEKDDVSDLPSGWVAQMLRVADGEMLAELMIEFDGLARQNVARLPLKEQKRLCENPIVQVVTKSGATKTARIQDLDSTEVRRVFDYGKIRSISDQKQLIDAALYTPDKELPRQTFKQPVIKNATFEQAIEFFEKSKPTYGHIREVMPLYQMVAMWRHRIEKDKKFARP